MKTTRYILGDLELETALHVGAGKGGSPTDSPLRRAGNGKMMLPGRALGGALRTIATRLAPRLGLAPPCWALLPGTREDIQKRMRRKTCGCPTCQLFGELYPNENDEKDGAASCLWISDAFVKNDSPNGEPREPYTHIRDGVGIAREPGAAARNVKYDYEVAPAGTKFSARFKMVDDDSAAAKKRALLFAAALAEWREGRGRLGGGAARGLGRFTLKNLQVVTQDIQTQEQLIKLLKSNTPWTNGESQLEWYNTALENARKKVQPLKDDVPAARSFVTLEFEIAIEGPFLINDPLVAARAGFDHAPLLDMAVNHAGAPVLSGSSLRGALRSRAERIARTLATIKWKQRDEFLAHCPACDPFANQPSAPLANCDRRLAIDDDQEVGEESLCLACRLFGSPRRGSRLWIEDAVWAGGALEASQWHAQDFLAIDRFTGGGKDGAKFDAAPLTHARFAARLTLHDPQKWELGWLMLVLRDLAEGELTIGFGAAKGYGRAHASNFKWTIGYVTTDDFPNANALNPSAPSGIYSVAQVDGLVPTDWSAMAQEWVTEFKDAAENFVMPGEMKDLKEDTFFSNDGELLKLYGLPRVGKEPNG